MSYAKSSARLGYDGFSSKLMSLAKSTERIKATELTYDHKNLIYQSIVVLLSSAIEEYHKSIIEDWFYRLRINNVTMDKVPDNAKIYGLLHSTEQHYMKFLYSKENEKEILEKLANSKQILKKYVDDTEQFDIGWLAKSVWSNKKYPSVKNTLTLYNRLGIPNIFNVLSSIKHKDYKNQLNSFLSVRESIVHQGAGAVTFEDVKNHIRFINELISLFDKELYKHCCRVAGSAYWPRWQNIIEQS